MDRRRAAGGADGTERRHLLGRTTENRFHNAKRANVVESVVGRQIAVLQSRCSFVVRFSFFHFMLTDPPHIILSAAAYLPNV